MTGIVVTQERHDFNCELCGWYDIQTITITRDGEQVARICHDGHVGGGDYNANDAGTAVVALLQKLFPDQDVSLVNFVSEDAK